jgi:hypothetical protein
MGNIVKKKAVKVSNVPHSDNLEQKYNVMIDHSINYNSNEDIGFIYVLFDYSHIFGTYIFDSISINKEPDIIKYINKKYPSNKILFCMEVFKYKDVMRELDLVPKLDKIFNLETLESIDPDCDFSIKQLILYMTKTCQKYKVPNSISI